MEYKRKRIEYIKKWPQVNKFDIEVIFQKKYDACKKKYKPFKYSVYADKDYNIVISNIIDALDNLPARPDIAFEFYWKSIDKLMKEFSSKTNSKEQLQDIIKNVLIKKANQNPLIKQLFLDCFKYLPDVSSKFIYKNIFEYYNSNLVYKDWDNNVKQLISRLKDFHLDNSKEKLAEIINYIEYIYGYPNKTNYPQVRNGFLFLKKLLEGRKLQLKKSISINSVTYNEIKLTFDEQMNFIINGLLYTFRNERFHGELISPFKSSKAKLKTYSHPFYCLIYAELILLLLLENRNLVDENEIVSHCNENLKFFNELF